MNKLILSILASTVFIITTSPSVLAHSKVTPAQTGIGKDEIFTATIENEKDIATSNVRLVLPKGIENVEAYAKPGWTVSYSRNGNLINEITWSNGVLPGRLKDTFTFDAQVPANPTKLEWKIYQTYEDGSIVAWADSNPKTVDKEGADTGPASYTSVADDLTNTPSYSQNGSLTLSVILSVVAILFSFYALLTRRK